MDFSNLGGSDIVVVLTVLVLAIALIVLIALGFKEKKKIAEVTLKNMDCVVHPILTFNSSKSAAIKDQTFMTPFGSIFVSADDNKITADKTSAVLVHIQDGPSNFGTNGAALTLAVTNQTKNPLMVAGGNVVATLTAAKNETVPKKALLGGIVPVTVAASDSKNTDLVVVGGDVPSDFTKITFAVTLSSTMQATPTAK